MKSKGSNTMCVAIPIRRLRRDCEDAGKGLSRDGQRQLHLLLDRVLFFDCGGTKEANSSASYFLETVAPASP